MVQKQSVDWLLTKPDFHLLKPSDIWNLGKQTITFYINVKII